MSWLNGVFHEEGVNGRQYISASAFIWSAVPTVVRFAYGVYEPLINNHRVDHEGEGGEKNGLMKTLVNNPSALHVFLSITATLVYLTYLAVSFVTCSENTMRVRSGRHWSWSVYTIPHIFPLQSVNPGCNRSLAVRSGGAWHGIGQHSVRNVGANQPHVLVCVVRQCMCAERCPCALVQGVSVQKLQEAYPNGP